MPKYRVLVEKVVRYVVDVMAPDATVAADDALNVMRSADDVEQFHPAETGYEVVDVYRAVRSRP